MSEEPFMEHPTGEYATALDAMDATISRLRALPEWNRWITFCAQGEGLSPGSIHVAEIRLVSDVLETGVPLNLAQVTAQAGVNRRSLTEAGNTRYSLAATTPREAAQILDALFRHQLGIRPFPDEDDDYAVGAEW
ncbi:MAG: hypothetical protein WA738_04705 [Candidatus Angelobacter sp.]